MGNLSFLHPTKNIENFNVSVIEKLIKDNFDVIFEYSEKFKQITLSSKKRGEVILDIFFDEENYLLDDIDEDLEILAKETDRESKKQFKELTRFKNEVLDKSKVLQISYGSSHEKRNKIIKRIKKEYAAFWLDEGIHPELMLPEEYNS